MDFTFVSEHHVFRCNNCAPVYYAAYGYNAVLFIDEPFVGVRFIINLESLIDIMQKFLETTNIIIENLDELRSCIAELIEIAAQNELLFLEMATSVVAEVFPYCYNNSRNE
jgi:ABC-type transporter Mla maintaining outer membrane lipid asymmetry ATPase subunit MlaF